MTTTFSVIQGKDVVQTCLRRNLEYILLNEIRIQPRNGRVLWRDISAKYGADVRINEVYRILAHFEAQRLIIASHVVYRNVRLQEIYTLTETGRLQLHHAETVLRTIIRHFQEGRACEAKL